MGITAVRILMSIQGNFDIGTKLEKEGCLQNQCTCSTLNLKTFKSGAPLSAGLSNLRRPEPRIFTTFRVAHRYGLCSEGLRAVALGQSRTAASTKAAEMLGCHREYRPRVYYWGYVGIMEKKMETAIL